MTDDIASFFDLSSEMTGYAYAAKHMALARYGRKIAFDESALEHVEGILEDVYSSESRSTELLCDVALFFGAFLGELICQMEPTAQWIPATEGGDFGVPFILLHNMRIFPYTWCLRRACNGPDNSVIKEFAKFQTELELRKGISHVTNSIERLQILLSKHGLNAGARVPPESIREFEEQNGVVLPADYAEFLCKIGNADFRFNSCNLKPFVCIPKAHIHSDNQGLNFSLLRETFPFSKAWRWSDMYDDEHEWAQHSAEWNDRLLYGNVVIATDESYPGSWCLVINGPEAGAVWLQTFGGIQPTVPRCSFSVWLEQLLLGEAPLIDFT